VYQAAKRMDRRGLQYICVYTGGRTSRARFKGPTRLQIKARSKGQTRGPIKCQAEGGPQARGLACTSEPQDAKLAMPPMIDLLTSSNGFIRE
jgi:hypothetical protein